MIEYYDLISDSRAFVDLNREFDSKIYTHAYLLIGEDEKLQFDFAKYTCMKIMCGCSECRICRNALNLTHADIDIYPKEDRRLNVEDVQKIVDGSILRGMEGERKIYIITGAEKILPQVQNKLLKILEEPPNGVVFILLAKTGIGFLPTVLSRVRQVALPKISKEKIFNFLSQKYKGSDRLEFASCVCDGSISRAEETLRDEHYYNMYMDMANIMSNLSHSSQIGEKAEMMKRYEKNLTTLTEILTAILRDSIMYRLNRKLVSNMCIENSLRKICELYPTAALIAGVELINEVKFKLQFNCNKAAVIDGLLIGLLEVRNKCLI